MKGYSLTRRLIYTVLLLELALALCTTGASLLYERSQRLHSYDIMLRGRADSLLGAVKDADDPADNATIDPKALDLKTEDLWEVRYPSGRVLGHSEGWTPEMESGFKSNGRGHNFSALGKRYRGLIIHGIRQIDQEGNNPGISRPVVIYYAASLKPVSEALAGAANFLLLANSLLLLLTGAALFVLLRRGLRPLQELKEAAAAIDSIHWQFRAPASASDVQELGVLAAALDSAMLRLEQSFRRQQTFVHNAAHELKTAVTIIKSSLQLLASRQRTAEEYARGLETCLADCERMEELVQRMLLLARFEQRDAHVLGRPESTDLAQRVHECVAQLQSFAELRRVALRLEREDSIFVPLSVEGCDTLIANLVMNALEHTLSGGRVSVYLRTVTVEAVLMIEDNGTGIGEDELPYIFERFYRGDPSRSRRTGGTGLGLAICKAITDSCGGAIEIQRNTLAGSGTRAIVRLPLTPKPAVEKPAGQRSTKDSSYTH
jgi:signal transduction histidine kinase